MTADKTPAVTWGAVGLERTGSASGSISLVALCLLHRGNGDQRQGDIVGTQVDIALRIVAELMLSVEGGAFVEIGKRHIRSDVFAFDGDNILCGAIGRIT